MEILIYLLKLTVDVVVSAIMLAMFARAILSFLPIDNEGGFTSFLVLVTEPVIFPVRWIFNELGLDNSFPLDIPFFITYLILLFISALV